ncbi:MAG: ABC transporter permease [Lachnospiraceae bacterium]
MSLTKQLLLETKKHKRRYNILIFLGFILLEMLFVYGNYSDEKCLSDGWMILFYNMPIMNSLFFPVLISTFASRLMDIEHKGDMLKCLYTFTSPETIFATKIIYGLISLYVLVTMQCLSILLLVEILDFPLVFSAKYMLFYGMNTFISCSLLFFLHFILAYFFRNQAVSISIGLIGSFIGLFSAYLPTTAFQKILPWSTFVNSLFIGMDWNPKTREVKWLLLDFNYNSIIYSVLWIAAFIILAIILLRKSNIEENNFKKVTQYTNTKVCIHSRPIEFMKLKGSPSWFAFIIIPILSAVIGTLNYLGNIEILTNGWFSLWTQHTLFLCYFFMPVIIAVFTGCIWQVDHLGTNMNVLLTHATPTRIILSKYAASLFITTLSLIWVVALYIISGTFCKITGSLPKDLFLWLLLGLIAAYAICAIQLFLSLMIRNFVLPVILAFIGGILGLACIAKDIPYALPYSLFSLAMTENNQNLNTFLFLISSVIFISIFLIMSIFYLKHTDAKS